MTSKISPDVVHESETQRQYVRVRLPAVLRIRLEDGSVRKHTVRDLSVGGISFAPDGQTYASGQRLSGSVSVSLEGIGITIPVKLIALRDEDGYCCAEFDDLDRTAVVSLRQLITAYVSGEVVDAGDVLHTMNRDNFTKPRNAKTARGEPRSQFRAWLGTAASFAIGVIALGYVASELYGLAFVTRSSVATVGGAGFPGTKPGEGTSFDLKRPLTLGIIAGRTVGSSGQRYAIPRSYVEEIVFGSSDHVDFAEAGERQLMTFRGKRVPCLSLGEILGTETNQDTDWQDKTLVLIRLASEDVFALAVDRVYDHEDVVVKPIAPAIMETRLYAGTTLLDDGRPMMLLDLPSIAEQRQLVNEMRSSTRVDEEEQVERRKTHPVMLFTGLDGRRRAVRLELVRRIDTIAREAIDIEGARAQAVIDGAIFSLVGQEYGDLPEDKCRLLRLSDGECEVVYAVREVLDAADMDGDIIPSHGDTSVEGVTLIGDQPVPVIDGHALFAKHHAPRRTEQPMSCRLPADSDWARTILEPLVEAAGYRVSTDETEEADVAIELAENAPMASGPARRVIRLRPEPELPETADDTIYRYDRDALLDALKQARMGKTA